MTSHWPPQSTSPFAAPLSFGTSGRPPSSPFTRFCYSVSWMLISAGAVGGLVFSLYRNDVLLGVSRTAGLERQYLDLERSVFGTPGWGTPRSLAPSEGGSSSTSGSVAAAALLPSANESAPPDSATPPANAERPSGAVKAPEPAQVAAERTAVSPSTTDASRTPTTQSPRSTSEGVTILSLESLPKETAGQRHAGTTTTVAAQPRSASPAPVAESRPQRHSAPAEPKPEPKRALAEPKRAPEPKPAVEPKHAAAEPKAAPAPKASKLPPAPANENPLNAAIRSAIMKDQK